MGKLFFQQYYSSLQCHMILLKSFKYPDLLGRTFSFLFFFFFLFILIFFFIHLFFFLLLLSVVKNISA